MQMNTPTKLVIENRTPLTGNPCRLVALGSYSAAIDQQPIIWLTTRASPGLAVSSQISHTSR